MGKFWSALPAAFGNLPSRSLRNAVLAFYASRLSPAPYSAERYILHSKLTHQHLRMSIAEPSLLQESDVISVFFLLLMAGHAGNETDEANHMLGFMSLMEELISRRNLRNLPFIQEFGPLMMGVIDGIMAYTMCGGKWVKHRDRLLMRRRHVWRGFRGCTIVDLLARESQRFMPVFLATALTYIYDFANAHEQGDYGAMLLAKEGAREICVAGISASTTCG
jgi:hypothetical protein